MIPGNDDALRAIRLFTSKIADSVIEGRALATEQDFAAEKDRDRERRRRRRIDVLRQYVDPKYAEEIMAETFVDEEPLGVAAQGTSVGNRGTGGRAGGHRKRTLDFISSAETQAERRLRVSAPLRLLR